MNKFAERLKEERLAANLTTSELSKKLNVAPRTIQRWERGDRMPDIDMLILVANALDVTIDYLVGRTND